MDRDECVVCGHSGKVHRTVEDLQGGVVVQVCDGNEGHCPCRSGFSARQVPGYSDLGPVGLAFIDAVQDSSLYEEMCCSMPCEADLRQIAAVLDRSPLLAARSQFPPEPLDSVERRV